MHETDDPPHVEGPPPRRVWVMTGLASIAFAALGAVYASDGLWVPFAALVGLGAICAGIAAYSARRAETELRSSTLQIQLGLALVGITAAALLSGQSEAPILWFAALPPIVAGIRLGKRDAVMWTAVAVSLVALVHLSGDVATVQELPPMTTTQRLLGQCFLIVLAASLGRAIRQEQGDSERMRQSERTVREQARKLQVRADELQIARDDAIAAARSKSEFLANMSHEIRTPLHGVLGMANLLRTTDLDERQKHLVETMHRSGVALQALVNDVLDFSKLEAGQLELESRPFDVIGMVEDVLDLFSHQAEQRRVDLAYFVSADAPDVIQGDIHRLRQVLVNLVGNAVKFTLRGAIDITIDAVGTDRLAFRVRDTGIGIPADKISGLFDAFRQVDSSTTREFGGTGLGLSISSQLVEMMGGTLSVESVVDEGSTFSFEIRAPRSTMTAEEVRSTQMADVAALLRQRVVVAVDRPRTRSAIVQHLRRIQMAVTEVDLETGDPPDSLASNAAALVISASIPGSPDVVARARQQNPKLRVIAIEPLTAAPGDVLHAFHTDGIVHRPVRRNHLYRVLDQNIGGGVRIEPEPGTLRDERMAREMPMDILLAEDNPVNRDVATGVLEMLGYRPDVASDGREVLERLRRRSYDVILMDMHMPVLDGIAAARAIRQTSDATVPWIIAMTANTFPAQQRECIEAGMNDFVSKPFTIDDVIHALQRAAKSRPAGVRAVPTAPPTNPLQQLRLMTAGQPERFRTLVRNHIANAAKLLAAIDESLDAKDAEVLERSAHSLKSTSRMFGNADVGELCQEIETYAEAGRWSQLTDRVGALRDLWPVAEERLRRELE